MGRLTMFDDPAAYRRRVEAFVLAHEAENNLFFGILSQVEAGRYPARMLAALSSEDGSVVAAALMTPPYNLILPLAPATAAAELADALHAESVSVPGLVAEPAQARAFADRWTALANTRSVLHRNQRVYRLTAVRPPRPAPGEPRHATPADRDLIQRWLMTFAAEALAPDEPVPSADRFFDTEAAGVLLWETAGQAVSMAGFSGPTPNGIRIGAVYTPPAERTKGYASACVAAVSQYLLTQGRRFCFLYTDLSNPTSNSIYQRIGYEPVCDSVMIRFE